MTRRFFEIHLPKWKSIVTSRHFHSSFLTLFLSLNAVFLALSAFLFFQNTRKIQESLETAASHTAFSIQEILNTVMDGAILVGSMPSVERVLNSDDPDFDLLYRMKQDVSSFNIMYSCDSMTIFFDHSQRIYDPKNGFYRYDDYIHPELLEAVQSSGSYEKWIDSPASLSSESDRNPLILTYIHRLPLYEPRARGYVALSLSPRLIREQAARSIGKISYPASISFDGRLLWSSEAEAAARWDPALSPAENMGQLLPHAKVFSFTTEAGTQTAFYVTTERLLQEFWPLFRPLISIWFLSVFLLFFVSVLFAVFMLRPMDAMMHKLGLPSYTETPDRGLDEYTLLNAALDDLSSQLRDIGSILQKNEQLIHDQLLQGLLYGYTELRRLPRQYAESGITFPYANFCLILASFLNEVPPGSYASHEQVRLLARNSALSAFSNLGKCYSLYLGNQYTAFILNTDHWEHLQAELSKICVVLRTSLREAVSLHPLFSISLCSRTEPNLYQSLMQARRLFLFSTGGASEEFVFFSSQQEYTPTIDQELSLSFTQCIMDKNPGRLQSLADQFHERFLPEGTEPEEAKRLCRIVLCTVFANLLELNIEVKENLLQGALSRLDNAQSAEECDQIVFSCFRQLTRDSARISDDAHNYIRKAIRYLEAHYAESLSIPQIASHTGVSAIYLNRIFKLSTGKTVSEYLNEYRTARSLPMLAAGTETVSRISEAVGYSDVRSYIRFFKKFYGMTPSEYRKRPENAALADPAQKKVPLGP